MLKKCTKCSLDKEIVDFSKKKASKDGFAPQCKECTRNYTKKHYNQNKDYYVDKASKQNFKVKEWLRSLKEKPCTDCNIQYPYYVMQFDHLFNKSLLCLHVLINLGKLKYLMKYKNVKLFAQIVMQ
jgi:hypothetical protein